MGLLCFPYLLLPESVFILAVPKSSLFLFLSSSSVWDGLIESKHRQSTIAIEKATPMCLLEFPICNE